MITEKNILESKVRTSIYQLISSSKTGAATMDITRKLNLTPKSVNYHLSLLEKHKLVVSKRVGNPRIYFLNRRLFHNQNKIEIKKLKRRLELDHVFGDERRRELASLILEKTRGVTQQELENITKFSDVKYHLNKLEIFNIIYSVKENKKRYYYITRHICDINELANYSQAKC